MVYIEEITEYFIEIFRLLGQKVLKEKQNLLNIFTIGGFGTACMSKFHLSFDKVGKYENKFVGQACDGSQRLNLNRYTPQLCCDWDKAWSGQINLNRTRRYYHEMPRSSAAIGSFTS